MFLLNCKGRLFTVQQPTIMAILNLTPDSFYEKSRVTEFPELLKTVEKFLEEGAGIIDIGGQSTRPGAQLISASEELERIIPAIEQIKRKFPDSFLSIDTFYSEVAKQAVMAGADMVNDISGGKFDPEMLSTVAKLKVPFICMHSRGNITKRHDAYHYKDICLEVLAEMKAQLDLCKSAGINDLILDPGFGFSKNIEENFILLKNLHLFSLLNSPILIGISRKSFIYKSIDTHAGNALNGTSILHTVALLQGVHLLRVHDVKAAMEAAKLIKLLN